MTNLRVVEVKVNYEPILKHFGHDFLYPIVNVEDPKSRTIAQDKLFISEVFYNKISDISKETGNESLTNELCFIVQVIRLISALGDSKLSVVYETNKLINDLRESIKMYQYLENENYEITEITIRFKSKANQTLETIKLTEDIPLILIEEKLKRKINKGIKTLTAFEQYFSDSVVPKRFADNVKNLSPQIFNLLHDITDLSKNNIYVLMAILYQISTTYDFEVYESDIFDLMKKWIKRAGKMNN